MNYGHEVGVIVLQSLQKQKYPDWLRAGYLSFLDLLDRRSATTIPTRMAFWIDGETIRSPIVVFIFRDEKPGYFLVVWSDRGAAADVRGDSNKSSRHTLRPTSECGTDNERSRRQRLVLFVAMSAVWSHSKEVRKPTAIIGRDGCSEIRVVHRDRFAKLLHAAWTLFGRPQGGIWPL